MRKLSLIGALVVIMGTCTGAPAQDVDAERRLYFMEGFEHIVTLLGTIQAIEAKCPAYEITPKMEAAYAVIGQLAQRSDSVEDVLTRVAVAMGAAARFYDLSADPSGFCRRILSDWGPESPHPLVQQKPSR